MPCNGGATVTRNSLLAQTAAAETQGHRCATYSKRISQEAAATKIQSKLLQKATEHVEPRAAQGDAADKWRC